MEEREERLADKPALPGRATLVAVALSAYLLGSFFPAGYINYLVRSKMFPETLSYREPAFDDKNLKGAQEAKIVPLLDELEKNPSAFAARYVNKPIIIQGQIQYFLDKQIGQEKQTLTLETGSEFRGIFLEFDDPKNRGLLELRKGGQVRAACMVSSNDSSNVHLSHCSVRS